MTDPSAVIGVALLIVLVLAVIFVPIGKSIVVADTAEEGAIYPNKKPRSYAFSTPVSPTANEMTSQEKRWQELTEGEQRFEVMKEQVLKESEQQYEKLVAAWKQSLEDFSFSIQIVGDFILLKFEGDARYTKNEIIRLSTINNFKLIKGKPVTRDEGSVVYSERSIFWGRGTHSRDVDTTRMLHGVAGASGDDFLYIADTIATFRLPYSKGEEVYAKLMQVLAENKDAPTPKLES